MDGRMDTRIAPAKDSLPAHLADRGEAIGDGVKWRPLATAAAVATVGYAIVAVAMVATGLFLTNVVLLSSVGAWDEDTTSWLADHRSAWMNRLSSVLSFSADTVGVIGLALLVVIVLAVRRRWWQIRVLVLGLALELLAFLLVNYVVHRPRPDVPKLGSTPSTSSFPSGHGAATFVLYGSVAAFVWLATDRRALRAIALAAMVLMPIAVGVARVYRGMHHPLDVLFGFLMGAGVLAVAIMAVSAGSGAPDDARDTSSVIEQRPPERARHVDLVVGGR